TIARCVTTARRWRVRPAQIATDLPAQTRRTAAARAAPRRFFFHCAGQGRSVIRAGARGNGRSRVQPELLSCGARFGQHVDDRMPIREGGYDETVVEARGNVD